MVGAPVSEILFAGHSGLYRCDVYRGEYTFFVCVCEIRSAGLGAFSLSNGVLLLVTAFVR